MADKTTSNFDFVSDVEAVLDFITDDKYIDELLDAIYPSTGSVEDAIVAYLSKCSFPSEVRNAGEVISALSESGDNCCYFLVRLYDILKRTIAPDKNEDLLIRLNRALFWKMYGISVKKCLGVGYAKMQIPNQDYLNIIPNGINLCQKNAHLETLQVFNTDVQKYSFKRTPDLKYYLPPIRSRNKSPKTKKKNIRRVERRAKRIIQLYGLKQKGGMFNNGRHLVPKQFADGIIKLCINTK